MGAPMKPVMQSTSKEKIKPALKGSWLGDMWREHSNILLVLLCSCDERRYKQWDKVSWWDYTGAARRSHRNRPWWLSS